MQKRFLLIPAVGFPLLAAIPAISSYTSVINNKIVRNNADVVVQAPEYDVNNYSVTTPSWTHYVIGEKLDLRDLKVTYNDPEKGAIDVTSESMLSMQNGQELTQEGECDVTIQHNNFNASFKIYVEKEAHEIPNNDPYRKVGDITVKYKLMSNQECIFTEYEDGEGTLEIPDFVEHDGVKYFIKQILSNWSDGENDIEGLKFSSDCIHLKRICDHAFEGTNCLDYYIDHKNELLEFPEGLEEIGDYAFSGTDYGLNSIRGYSFPSTLKKIGDFAFGNRAPYIEGDGDNGELQFRSILDISKNSFSHYDGHICRYVSGSSNEITIAMKDKLIELLKEICIASKDYFNISKKYLIPHLIGDEYISSQFIWGDITVECNLGLDECCLSKYISGSGTLNVPDYVVYNGKNYYVKEIPYNWSDGENDIKGLKFDCTHLERICEHAFDSTNCLDWYIDNKKEPLIFPEGLEEIGEYAFSGTDYGQNKIKGYSFPSTLKKIGSKAFGDHAPYIDGDDDNGILEFRSVPEIANDAFYIFGTPEHDCKHIYGSTMDIAIANASELANIKDFNKSNGFLMPSLIDGNCKISQFTWGDIKVECNLIDGTCTLNKYISGSGTLVIPDNVVDNDITYYVKQIPSNWSDGENDITGLKFASDCTHLKKICANAFKNTNCLDYYINNKNELLEFPEGLEEIGNHAFSGTDYGQNKIKGYSFPSTLKEIGEFAFETAPYIDGDNNNGVLEFKSTPTLRSNTFLINGKTKHDCKWIYGSTLDIAKEMHNRILTLKNPSGEFYQNDKNFNPSKDYLIPRLIGDNNYETIETKFGDITVECGLTSDECLLLAYVKGNGTLEIPDHIEHNGKIYYVKEILSNWSDGENDITGLEFSKDCTHLKKISANAFKDTNCLDKYINNKNEPLIFPEGLEEIGDYAFAGTDYGQNSIKGYSFPSTLKKISEYAFGNSAPYIDGDDGNGELHFKSVPEIHSHAFSIDGIAEHDCKYIYAPTQEMANKISQFFKEKFSGYFCCTSDFLIPKVESNNK